MQEQVGATKGTNLVEEVTGRIRPTRHQPRTHKAGRVRAVRELNNMQGDEGPGGLEHDELGLRTSRGIEASNMRRETGT